MTWPAPVLSQLQSRAPTLVHWLLWARVRPLGGGAAYGVGLWTGAGDETLTVEGEARLYHGAQGGLEIPPVRYRAGTEIATLEIGLSLTPEGVGLVRGTNTRLAPVELHCGVFDPATETAVGYRRMFKGLIDGTSLGTPEQEGAARMTIRLVSAARRGTMTRVGFKSDTSQRARDPADEFRKYADLGTVAADPWGGTA